MTGQYHNTRGLLSHFVKTLHLHTDAPFPSECADSRTLINAWRRSQEAKLGKKRLELVARDIDEVEHHD